MLHLDTLAPATLKLAQKLLSVPEISDARLVGGTALALQLGHRLSVDLDIFGQWHENTDLEAAFLPSGGVVRTGKAPRMDFFMIDDVKVDCVNYPYPWIEKPVRDAGLRLASVQDIAAMKLNAATRRGSRKDFVDIFFLLRRFSLGEMMEMHRRKYAGANEYIVLRSLTYFVDAEALPMPAMLVPFDWEEAKKTILAAVAAYA